MAYRLLSSGLIGIGQERPLGLLPGMEWDSAARGHRKAACWSWPVAAGRLARLSLTQDA